jgi:hypothetical protein
MKVVLESTTRLVTLVINGEAAAARVWEGETESGLKVHAYVTNLVASERVTEEQFQQELNDNHRSPSPDADDVAVTLVM